ncbi:MAG TPA: RNA 2',3'-cyclic phosphodiesterase [Tepidisphaeraceae bacterium]|jgi:2'-5' RNA ligase
MRLFTAIELPDPTRNHLAAIIEKLRPHPTLKDAVTWTRPENLHVTLKFLGPVEDKFLPNLIAGLRKITFPALPFTIERFLVLPGPGPARVLAATLTGSERLLADFFTAIEQTVAPLGIPRERRAYKPHVTLFRVRRPSQRLTAPILARLVDPGLLPAPPFTATRATLFESTLTPAGPIYAPLAHFPEPR